MGNVDSVVSQFLQEVSSFVPNVVPNYVVTLFQFHGILQQEEKSEDRAKTSTPPCK